MVRPFTNEKREGGSTLPARFIYVRWLATAPTSSGPQRPAGLPADRD